MTESDDMRLLREYASSGSQEAFSELVARLSPVVRAVAQRQLGDVDEVQDVSQTVFMLLAKKGGRLNANTLLTGWLCRTARLVAIRLRRGEQRRQKLEQETYMQSTENQNQPDENEAAWSELEAFIDDFLDQIPGSERDAILARYFGERTTAQAAASLYISEAALKKRLARGLEGLRKLYARRGVRVTAQGLAGAISANAVLPVTPALIAKLCAIGVHKGAACSAAVQALAQSTLRALAWLKFKAIATWSAAAILAVSAGALAVREAVARPGPAPATLAGTWRVEGEARQLASPAFTNAEAVTRFVLTLNGTGQWRMQVTASPNFSQMSEMACDGTNLYNLLHGVGGLAVVNGRVQGSTDAGFVYPRPVRAFSPRLASIWWTFCSPAVLGQEGQATCPNFLEPFADNVQLIAQQTLSTNLPRLGLEESRAYANRRPGTGQPPNYALRALEVGETNGVLYPKVARVQQYQADSSLSAVYEVVCAKVEPVEAPRTFVPELTGPVSVTDYRLPSLRATYSTTNWYSQAEVERLVAARSGVTVASSPALPPPPSPGRQQARLLMLFGFAGTSFFFLLRFVFVRPRYY